MAHSAFKAAVKRDLDRPEMQQRLGDREAAREAGDTSSKRDAGSLQQLLNGTSTPSRKKSVGIGTGTPSVTCPTRSLARKIING